MGYNNSDVSDNILPMMNRNRITLFFNDCKNHEMPFNINLTGFNIGLQLHSKLEKATPALNMHNVCNWSRFRG